MAAAWYAVAVAVRSERSAADGLRALADDVLVPLRIERRAWSDRIKRFEAPLFPGYIFARMILTPAARILLLKVRNVVDVVGRRAGHPEVAAAIPDDEIMGIQRIVAAERAVDPLASLVVGRSVVVGAGPLRGVRGIVEEAPDGQRRLVVNVTLLGRAVRTVLLADDVLEAE